MFDRLLVFFLVVSSVCLYGQVRWMTIGEALAAQKSASKKILIDFYADWCKPCREMDAKTYGNPVIAKIINENFYPVRFNSEERDPVTIFGRTFANQEASEGRRHPLHDFTKFMSVSSVPALVFIDEQAMPITKMNGDLTAAELEPYLSVISKNIYQKISTKQEWEEFRKKFRSRLTD